MLRFTRRAGSAAIALAALAPLVLLWALPVRAGLSESERSAAAVVGVEHEWLSALRHRDVKRLARILGREFIDSDYQGDAIPRARYLAYFAHPAARSAPLPEQRFEKMHVRFIARGKVAIVTGVVLSRTEPAAKADASASLDGIRHSRFTDVFVWRDARWQAVTGQETHFTPTQR